MSSATEKASHGSCREAGRRGTPSPCRTAPRRGRARRAPRGRTRCLRANAGPAQRSRRRRFGVERRRRSPAPRARRGAARASSAEIRSGSGRQSASTIAIASVSGRSRQTRSIAQASTWPLPRSSSSRSHTVTPGVATGFRGRVGAVVGDHDDLESLGRDSPARRDSRACAGSPDSSSCAGTITTVVSGSPCGRRPARPGARDGSDAEQPEQVARGRADPRLRTTNGGEARRASSRHHHPDGRQQVGARPAASSSRPVVSWIVRAPKRRPASTSLSASPIITRRRRLDAEGLRRGGAAAPARGLRQSHVAALVRAV